MEKELTEPTSSTQEKTSDIQSPNPPISIKDESNNDNDQSSTKPTSSISSWAKILKLSQTSGDSPSDSQTGESVKSAFARLKNGLGLQTPVQDGGAGAPDQTSGAQVGVLESFTKGLVDTSRGAVKAVQVKARHMVSQNKRRYQEGGFDLDMTYITDNIIAMGFPAGDISSGIFGYVEGFYRNHIEEVIKFFETHHQGKYKVYNLCSERLYDASLFQGKAASCPFDDHNCPPINLILSFCQSAYTWLKADIDNVVVIHCKAGLGRTGLMISSLLLYLKFCSTAEESMNLFNQKRCIDGMGLVLPSQIRYVKYFERILKDFQGNTPEGRRCMLRGFKLHKCPYWIRPSITISNHNGILFTTKKHPKTKDLMPEDFWISSSKKGIVIFALPGEPGLTELNGDFKIHFHDRHGDFYCWLNTTMIDNRLFINSDDLDGFDKRKLPSPTFQIEIVMIDYDGTLPKAPNNEQSKKISNENSDNSSNCNSGSTNTLNKSGSSKKEDNDDVFTDSDGDGEEGGSGSSRMNHHETQASTKAVTISDKQVTDMSQRTQQMSIKNVEANQKTSVGETNKSTSNVETPKANSSVATDFKAIAADASVFSFGDDEDYDSE